MYDISQLQAGRVEAIFEVTRRMALPSINTMTEDLIAIEKPFEMLLQLFQELFVHPLAEIVPGDEVTRTLSHNLDGVILASRQLLGELIGTQEAGNLSSEIASILSSWIPLMKGAYVEYGKNLSSAKNRHDELCKANTRYSEAVALTLMVNSEHLAGRSFHDFAKLPNTVSLHVCFIMLALQNIRSPLTSHSQFPTISYAAPRTTLQSCTGLGRCVIYRVKGTQISRSLSRVSRRNHGRAQAAAYCSTRSAIGKGWSHRR